MGSDKLIQLAIVDDHELFRKGLVSILNEFSAFQIIIEADNGKALIDKINSRNEIPDVILLDISMPQLNGYETARLLRKKWPDLKVLILSMYNDEHAIIRMLNIGVNGFLSKDATPEEVKNVILEIYKHGFYYTPFVSQYFSLNISENNKSKLTDRELEFLSFCPTDLSYCEIAKKMGISSRTVENYYNKLYNKLHVKNRVGLALTAINMGLKINTDVMPQ